MSCTSGEIDLVLKHQMALANQSPKDGASSKCSIRPPHVQILEGPEPPLGFLFCTFSCCFTHAPSVLGLVHLHHCHVLLTEQNDNGNNAYP